MSLIQPVEVSLPDFPSSTLSAQGMVTLPADLTPRYGTVLLGVPYAERSGHPLHLQILLPPMTPESSQLYPGILYVQGSAWFARNLGQELPGLSDFTRRGYVIAIVEYRPSTVAPFPAQVDDTESAVRFVRENAAQFHIDLARLAVWGDSSGGHTYLDPEPLGLPCAVDFYGPTDISRMNEEPSIMDHTAPGSPEGMLIGRQPVAFYRLEGSDHGGPAFWQPDVLDIVDGFLRENLG